MKNINSGIFAMLFFCASVPTMSQEVTAAETGSWDGAVLISVPYAISSSAPFDERMVEKAGCTFLIKNPLEIARLRSLLAVYQPHDDSPPYYKGFRQALIFEAHGRREAFYFRMTRSDQDFLSAEHMHGENINNIKFPRDVLKKVISGIKPEDYLSSPRNTGRVECSSLVENFDK